MLSASPASPAIAGSTVTLTATVAPSVVTGNVTFKDGVAIIAGCGSALVSSGIATCVTSLTTAVHTLSATYNGDSTFDSSTSANVSYTVSAAAASDCFRSATTGNWNVVGSWQQAKPVGGVCPTADAAFVAATSVPTSSATGIRIRSGHTITVSAAASAAALTVDSGGELHVSASQTLSLADGTGIDLTDNGTVVVSGTLTQAAGSTVRTRWW